MNTGVESFPVVPESFPERVSEFFPYKGKTHTRSSLSLVVTVPTSGLTLGKSPANSRSLVCPGTPSATNVGDEKDRRRLPGDGNGAATPSAEFQSFASREARGQCERIECAVE